MKSHSFQREHPETNFQYSNNSSYVMVQRHVDNAKERNRNKNVNVAFSTLRTLIPTEPRDRKLSKIETLRLATSYIVHLANMIRARTEGDFGDQVCQRYGCLFRDEVNSATNQKHICTFCLTDDRRNVSIFFYVSYVTFALVHKNKKSINPKWCTVLLHFSVLICKLKMQYFWPDNSEHEPWACFATLINKFDVFKFQGMKFTFRTSVSAFWMKKKK